MKSLRFIGIAILAVFMSVGITACGDDNSQQIEEPNFISKNLHVKTAGDLSTLISDEELLNISELTLSGFINGTDVGYIQKMKNLTKIDLSNLHIVGGGNSYWGDGNNSHTWDNIFPEYFFENKPYLKEVKISNSVTKIGKYAFHDCPSLTSINIPNSVTVIGIRAFDGCKNLASVNISHGVTKIEEYAFYNCPSLTSINIPNSVVEIKDDVFRECTNLISIDIPESVNKIGGGIFCNCTNLTSVSLPNSITKISRSTFRNCIYNHRTTKTNQKYPSVNL